MDVSGQVAVVTGGASGLGAATARRLAADGAQVGVLDFDADRGAAVAEEIGGFFVRTDVGDETSVAAAIAAVKDRFGAPRIAVNCAGIGLAARVVGRDGALSTSLFERTIRVNLMGTYHVMSHAAREMAALDPLETGERGVVINTASVAWQDGQIGQAAYAASKGAIAAMCLPVAREFAKLGIRVVAIAPGLFETPMMMGLPEETTKGIVANIPFPHRLGDPAEYALMAAQIVANPYLNGTTIRLDAAVRLPPR
ncbi:SDR family NAD(P)-dependent oxidoreductase [Thetidibacter halocola]|uniref:SDR family NAD(P)-dependent oxidoreductase n=1 Tax=Thetidibacter halocola TaxID=2827239 RepID=A0A8J8BAI9_9RHOB|nr:SDR family NAD(P)-dependent oxidoreductase [Thetidibacter halocola]MBS0125253.1 SDR family NAD(P)-dependent oxidoreductase [Thetidibacter halocola]